MCPDILHTHIPKPYGTRFGAREGAARPQLRHNGAYGGLLISKLHDVDRKDRFHAALGHVIISINGVDAVEVCIGTETLSLLDLALTCCFRARGPEVTRVMAISYAPR